MTHLPKLLSPKPILAIKGRDILPVVFENDGADVVSCSVTPSLPMGLSLTVEGNTCVLVGKPRVISAKSTYEVEAFGANDEPCQIRFELAVQEALVREQREEIIKVHDNRGDLDTPRSQVENALGDQATMGSNIKPHEKFMKQPMGDDSHLTAQAANNVDAKQRAEASPELTPSPSAQLQNQAILSAKPTVAPTPGK